MTAKRSLWVIYIIYFLYNLHVSLGLYINSSFLGEGCNCGIPANFVGLLFTAGSLLSILLILNIRRLSALAKSSKRLIALSGAATIATLVVVALTRNPWLVGGFFVVYWAVSYLFLIATDVLVEEYSTDATTGDTRGMFLSIAGLAVMIAPFAAGRLAEQEGGFVMIYMAGAALVVLSLIILLTAGRSLKEPRYIKQPLLPSIRLFFSSRNLTAAFISNFLLQIFYSWMVIYTPLYLIEQVGLSWTELGVIFTVMLIPFVVFEVPLGKLADRRLGEKEITIVGLVVTAAATASLAFITSESVSVWMAALFITRVGASALQVGSESHFFKQVNESHVGAIGIFRQAAPLAFVVGPLLATAILTLTGASLVSLFPILAMLLLIPLPFLLRMRDSK
jgi:MFS family permease